MLLSVLLETYLKDLCAFDDSLLKSILEVDLGNNFIECDTFVNK